VNKTLEASSLFPNPLIRTLLFFAVWLVSLAAVRFLASQSLELASLTVAPALTEGGALAVSFCLAWAGVASLLRALVGMERAEATREARKSAGWAAGLALSVFCVSALIGFLTTING
jgi:hypothetical protein